MPFADSSVDQMGLHAGVPLTTKNHREVAVVTCGEKVDWKQYADKLYYEEGFAETHPAHRGVYDFEVRMRKYANNEEKLAIDKKP